MRSLGALVFIMLLSVVACTPDSLEGFEENNGNNGGNNGTTVNNTSNNGGGGAFTTEFTEVSGILAANCGQIACHGSAASSTTNKFTLVNNQLATPAEMMGALDGIVGVGSGRPMIVAGNAAGSDIYAYMVLAPNELSFMPRGGTVTPAELTAIETWITAGAVYQQEQ